MFGLFDFTNLTKFKFLLNNGCRVNGFKTIFVFGLRLYKVLILVILVLLFFVFIQFRSDFSVKYLLYPRFKALLPTIKLYPDIGSLRLVFRGTFLRCTGLSGICSKRVELFLVILKPDRSSDFGMILRFGLLCIKMDVNFGRRPISSGNEVNLLCPKKSTSSFLSLPISFGNDSK